MQLQHPDPADIAIGGRIRQMRQLNNVTQPRLGDMLGITFQQVQKHEEIGRAHV